jgi:hypothetical protein
MKMCNKVGLIYFGSVMAPIMWFTYHNMRKKNPMVDINIEVNNKENSSMFLILISNLLPKKGKMFITLILIGLIIYLYLNGINIKHIVSGFIDLKRLLLILIIIPIFINIFFLLLFE